MNHNLFFLIGPLNASRGVNASTPVHLPPRLAKRGKKLCASKLNLFVPDRVWTAVTPPVIEAPEGAAAIEQRTHGTRPPAALVASFDGLGVGFTGPQGTTSVRQPSDNSLAVGPDHIVQTVNTRMAIFTKQGKAFDVTGRALYGPVPTNNVFRGFGGTCEARNNGMRSCATTRSRTGG